MSQIPVVVILNITLQCLVVGFILIMAPLNSMVPAHSTVIKLTTLVVVKWAERMMDKSFWSSTVI